MFAMLIAVLDKEIARCAREDEVARRLMTIPDIAPITATAITDIAARGRSCGVGRGWPEASEARGRSKGANGTTVCETGPEEPTLSTVPLSMLR